MSEYICPHCKKPVYDDEALLCLYCGESLNRGKSFLKPKILFIIIVAVILISFFFLML